MEKSTKDFLDGVAYYTYKLVSMYTSVFTWLIFNLVERVRENG